MSDLLDKLNNANLGFIVTDGSAQIITPSIQSNIDSKRITALLRELLPPERVHPLSADEDGVYPDVVYEIHGSTSREWLQVVTGYEGGFLLKFRSENYNQLTQLVDQFSLLIDAETGIEITNIDARWNADINVNQITLEVFINTPIGFDGESSVLLVKRGCKADPNQLQNCLKQAVHCKYHFVIQAKSDLLLNNIKASLIETLLGSEQGSNYSLMEYDGDTPFESIGGLRSWVVTYRDFHIIHN